LEYTYGELKQATSNFDNAVKLGSGSYGGVFKGVLKEGTEVAIKVLEVPNEAGFEEEVKVLSKFRHPNLVILMGFARNGPQRLLVYEMLAGGDVHRRLQRSSHENIPFSWQERVGVALDAACGLSHLHHSSPKVFHRDIKSPNILLDKNGTAKMADFGLACLSHTAAHRVARASGTVGYACPLYVRRGVVSEGSEVYSFGMVLLELLTAHPPAYMSRKSREGDGQIQYLTSQINGDISCVLKLLDRKAQWPPAFAERVAELALSCTQMQEESRPSFADVVRSLRALESARSVSPVRASSQERRSSNRACEQPLSPHEVPQSEPLAMEFFSLECVRAQGADLQSISLEKRRILHGLTAQEAHGDIAAAAHRKGPLCVGRAFQTPLFEELVAKSASGRSTISREHFQIWMDSSPAAKGLRRFVLKNCSGNGTRLNDQLLQGRGDQAPLQHGDLVTLTRFGPTAGKSEVEFIQFRFDLSSSCLEGVDLPLPDKCPSGDMQRAKASPTSSRDGRRERFPASNAQLAGTTLRQNAPAVPATPKPNPDAVGDLASFLEVLGPGVKMQLPDDARRLAFAPVQSSEPFSSFLIGRAHQLDFWPEVLQPEALSTLSRQHVEVQTWRAGDGRFSFVARNLSDVNPVHVIANIEACEPCVLAKGEQRHLLDGDRLVLNLGQAHAFWMTFTDLTGVRERTRRAVRQMQSAICKDDDLISTAATPHDLQDVDDDRGEGRFLLKATPTLNLTNMSKVECVPRRGGSMSPWRIRSDDATSAIRSSRSSTSFASTMQAKGGASSSIAHQQWASMPPKRSFSPEEGIIGSRPRELGSSQAFQGRSPHIL